jgi:hypothetical protein
LSVYKHNQDATSSLKSFAKKSANEISDLSIHSACLFICSSVDLTVTTPHCVPVGVGDRKNGLREYHGKIESGIG